MIQYAIRKILLAIPLILGVVTLIFVLVQLSPGDATDRFFTPETPPEVREMVMKKWGLDQPVHVQYFRMIHNMFVPRIHCENQQAKDEATDLAWYACPLPAAVRQKEAAGEPLTFYERIGEPGFGPDFGVSIAQERPVFEIISEKLPNTLLLSGVTLTVAIITGISLGILQAIRQYSTFDNVASVTSLFFYSMPSFWLALMLILIFSLYLQDSGGNPLLPASGMIDAVQHDYMSRSQQFWDRVKHLLLPGVGLGIASSASMARYMRSSMLEVIRQDYVRTARAKGLSEAVVILKHAVRNALLPIITIIGLSLPYLFSGSVLIEYVFAWPGMGRVIVEAIFTQDTPLIIACFFVFTILVVAGNLLADIAYSVVDPRIRLG